jgi:uncharacterized integral membrane protein
MAQTRSENLRDETGDALADRGAAQNSNVNQLVLHYPKWKIKAILIESLIIVFGFVSVVIYNFLFNSTVSPVLGVVIGAVNGSLVAWCITHADQTSIRNKVKNSKKQAKS